MTHKTIALLTLFVLALTYSGQPIQQSTGRASIQHVVTVNEWGLVLIEDRITLQHPAPDTLFIGYPRNCSGEIAYLRVIDGHGNPLQHSTASVGDLVGVNVSIPSGVEAVTVKAVVYGTVTRTSEKAFNVMIPLCPSLSIRSITSTVVELPEGVSIVSSKPQKLDRVSENSYAFASGALEPYTPMWESVTVECEQPLQPLVCLNEEVEVRVNQFGVRVSQTLEFEALVDDVSEVTLPIPVLASDVEARDDVGSLDVHVENSTVRVSLRLTLKRGEAYSITLTYTVPKTLVLSTDGRSKTLTVENIPTPSWFVKELELSFILPPGSKVVSSTPETYDLHGNIQTGVQVTYSFSNVSPLNPYEAVLTYRRPFFCSLLRPLVWAFIAIAAVAAAVALSRVKGVPPPPPAVPKKDVMVLVELYEERVSIDERMEELDRRLRDGKMSVKEYRRRSSALRRRLLEVDARLKAVSRKVKAEYPELADVIADIEVAEAEVRTTRAAMRSLEMRRRRGEISKAVYDRIRSKYVKRLEKAKKSVSRGLSKLRAEAGG